MTTLELTKKLAKVIAETLGCPALTHNGKLEALKRYNERSEACSMEPELDASEIAAALAACLENVQTMENVDESIKGLDGCAMMMRHYLEERHNKEWDAQIEHDGKHGSLDALYREIDKAGVYDVTVMTRSMDGSRTINGVEIDPGMPVLGQLGKCNGGDRITTQVSGSDTLLTQKTGDESHKSLKIKNGPSLA